MAAPTITHVGSNAQTAASATIATGATVTATTAGNDWLVVVVAASPRSDNPTPIASCSDSVGNVYTLRAEVSFGSGAAGNGAALTFFTAPVTVNITSGTVTATGPDPCNERCIQVFRVTPASGTISFITADNTGVGGNLTNHAATTVSVTNGNTIFGCAALETDDPVTGDSDTSNGSWSTVDTDVASGTSDAESLQVVTQYKTVIATGNQSWACSTTSARQGVCSYLVIKAQTAVALSLSAALGQYTMTGQVMTPKLGHVPIVAGVGSYALTGTAVTLSKTGTTKVITADPGAYALTGSDVTLTIANSIVATAGSYVLTGLDAALKPTHLLGAAAGSYALTGTDVALAKTGIGAKTIVADPGSYVLTGTDATFRHTWRIAAGDGAVAATGDLLLETSDYLLLETADRLLLEDATAGVAADSSYLLTGSNVALNATAGNKTLLADVAGSYALTGTSSLTLHGWRIVAGDEDVLPLLDELGNPLLDELGNPLYSESGGAIIGGAYALAGSDVALTPHVGQAIIVDTGSYALTGTAATPIYSAVGHFIIAVEAGSYALTGTDVTLRASAPAVVSPLHIGEWPINKKKRRQREQADAKAIAARARFRRAIERLLEGLPPEFDEPEALDQALDNAVQAANLLYALSAPIREINAVNELIDHIRQLRIAQPIAQAHLAQAYNQAHRHLVAKANEDAVMALLLGE